jgi:hypothetical protein
MTKKRAAQAAKLAQVILGPAATYPGFRIMPDGTSRVFVQVSKKVGVSESKAAGRVVYRMRGVQTIKTNQFPLVTAFFPTPVGKVQLVPQGADLDMVIELRRPSDAQHRVLETERGMVLQVDFPPLPAGTTLPPPPSVRRPEKRGSKAQPAGDAEPDSSY